MRGVQLDSSVQDLEPIVERWLSLFERAASEFPQSNDSYFFEETLCSLLSASSWLCGVPSIIEVKTPRGGKNGRVDILILSRGTRTAIEAKLAWFADTDGPSRTLIPALREATEQLEQLPPAFADRRIALALAVFERRETPMATLLTKTLEVAPTCVRAWTVNNEGSDAYPGFCVIGQLVPAA